jgi:hypothetical protein
LRANLGASNSLSRMKAANMIDIARADERHQQRHKLVGTRLETDAAGAAKRASAAPQREQQGVLQEHGVALSPVALW